MTHSLSSMLSTPHLPAVRPAKNNHRRLALSAGSFLIGLSRLSVSSWPSTIHSQRSVAVLAATEPPAPPASNDDGAKSAAAAPSQGDAKKEGPDLLSFLSSFLPGWASWVLGAVVLLFGFPFYRKILKIEDTVEKAVEMVEEVAGEAEKISRNLAESLPENSQLKQVALKVERIAEEVEQDAEKVETIMKKVDEVVEQVETTVKHVIDEGKERKQERNGSKEQSTDSKNTV